jgi:hypothetical protein
MKSLARLLPVLASVFLITAAAAEGLPGIAIDERNDVPGCVTTDRLMAFLRERNPRLDARFSSIAAEYRKWGEELGVRWDYAFFQMFLETAALTYRRPDGRPGRIEASQNNFAALGLADRGAPGDRFPSVSSGVEAHMRRIAGLAGLGDDDTSSREGLVDWGGLAGRWAPSDRSYATSLEAVAKRYFDRFCTQAAPPPAVASSQRISDAPPPPRTAVAGIAMVAPADRPGAEIARQAIERAREKGETARVGLGAPIEKELPERGHWVTTQPGPAPSQAKSGSTGAASGTKVASLTQPVMPQPQRMVETTVDPADSAVLQLVSNRTVLLDTPVGSTIPIAFSEDGTMKGQAGNLGFFLGARADEGRWWVSRGRLCQRWKVWFDREAQCLSLRQAGQTIHWSSDKGKTGTAKIANN